MLREATSVKGFRLGAIDGEIGHVKEFYFDDHTWHVRYLVADTGHWLPHRKVLIAPQALGWVDSLERVVHVQLTREQVEKSPSIDVDKPVSRQFEEEYLRYFGWPFYWADPLVWGPTAPMLPVEPPTTKGDHDDPHLRSVLEVIGYHLQTRDGEFGHVHDFLLDDDTWAVRDLVIDTGKWFVGRRIAVATEWVKRISWQEKKIYVGLDKESLQEFPEHEAQGDQAKARDALAEALAHQPMAVLP